MSFAVIKVTIDRYDGMLEGAECLDTFATEQEATDLIQKIKEKQSNVWRERINYIENFVDKIELPKTEYQGWLEFLKQFHPFGIRYVFPKDFKREYKNYLRNYNPKLEGYNPPYYNFNWNREDLVVVEIKNSITPEA